MKGLAIAGRWNNVNVRNSEIGDAVLSDGAGKNLSLLDHTKFTNARIQHTEATRGQDVTYPYVDDTSTMRGLREQGGGWKSAIKNKVIYPIQDFWGSRFGGDRRKV